MHRPVHLFAICAAAGLLAGCGESSTNATADGQVSFQIASANQAAASDPSPSSETITVGSDVLVIEKVELVVRKIELEGAQAQGACTADDNASQDASDSADDDCSEVKAGPLLLDLPLGVGAEHQFTVDIPAGSYSQLHFQIHRPTGRPEDQVFLAAHPDFDGTSLRVTGTFNGTPFTFSSDLEIEQQVHFATPIEVAAGGTTGLTLSADLHGWFLDAGATALVDPAATLTAPALRAQVENNIRASFRAFHDDDHDGADDD